MIAAGAVELSFFLLDLIRLEPLSTAFRLSGAGVGPGGMVVDLTTVSGVVAAGWAAYQVVILTIVHFLAFGLVGALAALLFDWSKPGRFKRLAVVAVLCTAAFYAAVALSSSVMALESVSTLLVLAMNVLAAGVMVWSLQLVCAEAPEDCPSAAT